MLGRPEEHLFVVSAALIALVLALVAWIIALVEMWMLKIIKALRAVVSGSVHVIRVSSMSSTAVG